MAKQIAKREVGLGLNIAEFAKNAKTADQLLDNLTKGRTVKIGTELDLGSVQQALQKIIDFKTVSIKFAPDVKDLFGVMEKGIADFEKQGSQKLAKMNRSFLDDFKEGFKNVSFKLDDGSLIKGYDEAIKHAEQLIALTDRQVDAIGKVNNVSKQQTAAIQQQKKATEQLVAAQEKLNKVQLKRVKTDHINRDGTKVKYIPQIYTALDGRYRIEKGTVGWNVYEKGKTELVAYYDTLKECRENLLDLAGQEGKVAKDAVNKVAKGIKEGWEAGNTDSGSRTIHSDTVKDLRYQIAGIKELASTQNEFIAAERAEIDVTKELSKLWDDIAVKKQISFTRKQKHTDNAREVEEYIEQLKASGVNTFVPELYLQTYIQQVFGGKQPSLKEMNATLSGLWEKIEQAVGESLKKTENQALERQSELLSEIAAKRKELTTLGKSPAEIWTETSLDGEIALQEKLIEYYTQRKQLLIELNGLVEEYNTITNPQHRVDLDAGLSNSERVLIGVNQLSIAIDGCGRAADRASIKLAELQAAAAVESTTAVIEQQKARLQEIYEIADRNRNRDLKKEHPDSVEGLREKIGELQTLIPQLQTMQEEVSKMGVASDSVNFKSAFATAGVLAEAIANKTKDLQFYNTTLENTIKLEEFAAKAYEKYGIKTRSKKFSSEIMRQYKDLLLQLNNGMLVEDAMKALDEVMKPKTSIEALVQPTIEQGAVKDAVLESAGNKPVEVPVTPVVEGNLSKLIMGSAGETYAGGKAIGFKYAVIDVENLTISHDAYGKVNPNYPTELQPRDRSRVASVAQILGMVKNINPNLLTSSPTAQNGSPIVSKDGVVIGGNARSAALLEAYKTGHADGYKSYIIEHAKEFGLNSNNMPNNPVLVRVVDIDGGLDTLAKQLNESTTTGYSTTEQALINEELVMRVISKLNLDESANLNSQANKDFVNSFINLLSDNQRNEMVTKDGSLSAVGAVKVRQAIAGAAYGSREMLENLELISPELVNISNALISGAAKAADIRYSIESGALNDLGVVSTILKGLDLLKSARGQNQKISEYLNQSSLFGTDYSAEDVAIGKFLEANVRNAANLRNMVDTILDFARSAGDPNQISFDGLGASTLSDAIRGAFVKYSEKYQKSINYDELIQGYLPAEAGSRSDKRVDRTNVLDVVREQVAAEKQLTVATEQTAQSKSQQGQAAKQAVEGTQAQIDAEKQLNRTIEEGTNSRRNALQILRDADKITKTGYKFDEVFNFTDLENKLTNFVQQISNDSNLKIGKVNVAEYTDDGAIGWISYYNNETKKALEQTFELKDGILQLGKMKFSQDFKALDAQALAQAKKDFNDLISLTKKLNEADLGFYKAQNLGIDTSSYIANMESHAQRITEIRNRLTLSAEQETELTRINNQHLLAKAKLLDGIASKEQKVQDVVATQEKKMQENITNITQRVNESMKQWASDGSFNNIFPPELQNQINQFKASLSNLGKETNFAQLNQAWDQITQKAKEATKAAQEYKNAFYKNQFQNEYKYNNGKTVQDQVVLDSYADYYKKEEEKAQQFSNNIKSIYDRLMSTMKEFNNVSTKLNNVTLQDKGSGLYQKQIQNLQDQKSSLFADLRSLSGEMEEALSLKLPSGSAGFTAFFQDTRVQTELGTEAVKKFIDTLKQMENINFDFASKLSAQVQPVIEKIQSLEQMIKSGFIDKNSDIAKNILNFDSTLSGKLNSFNESHSAYDAQDVIRYAEQISEVISLYEKAAKAEQQYFAGKQKYTANTSMQTMAEDAKKAAEEVSGAQQKLTTAAQKFAEESGASGAILTNFVQGADGIARLDFSVFDSGTNSLRKFRMEMGSVSDGTYITETTVNNFVSKTQQAAKQLQTVSDLISRLQFSGANMDNSSVVRLVERQGKLATELSKGPGANQNVLSQLVKDAKLSTAEVEKLYKQFVQLENLVGSGDAIDLGKINFSGDITQQLKDSLAAWGEEKNFTNIKLTGLNEATGKFKVTAEGADNTVRTFTGSLNKLGQSASMQQTNVTELSSKWDKFKASLSKTGKQLMTALVGYNVFFKVISEIRKGINYVKDIDLAMTELKKVTDESEASYNRFLETASKSASIVGSTVSSFTEATANFARLGYSIDESAKMAETAIVYKNVADGLDTVDEATESIISTMKAFGIESSDTMGIIDRFNEVGNNFAITSAGIGEALQRSASALAEAGNSIDESIGLVTAANSVIQNPEQVGEMLADYKVA